MGRRRAVVLSLRFLLAVIGAAIASTVLPGGTALAASAAPAVTGLEVVAVTGDAANPALQLTNTTDLRCQVATSSFGTIRLISVDQGAGPIAPTLLDVSVQDGLEWTLQDSLRTLAPGESIRLDVPVVDMGPSGPALATATWSATAATVGSYFPIAPGEPLTVEARYEMPFEALDDGAPLCQQAIPALASATSASPVGGDASTGVWLVVGVIAAGSVVAAVVAAVVIVRNRRGTAVTVVVLAVTAATVGIWSPEPANAEIDVHPNVAAAYAECREVFERPGHDPANILPTLDGPDVVVHIRPNVHVPMGHTGDGRARDQYVDWRTDSRWSHGGDGVPGDPCAALYHELFHAFDSFRGTIEHRFCQIGPNFTGIPVREVEATRAENSFRRAAGLPERSTYGRRPLPEGECRPVKRRPEDPKCVGRPPNQDCADLHGDPHLRTFDGRRWSFQGAGEFVATSDPAGGFEVQTRQEPVVGSRQVSVNTAAAFAVDGSTVEVALAGRSGAGSRQLVLSVDGERRDLIELGVLGPAPLGGGGGSVTVAAGSTGPVVALSWADGSHASVGAVGAGGLHITVEPAKARATRLRGLLGDFDGNPDNDISSAGGQEVVEIVTFDALYPDLANSWRVDASTSLFAYAAGTTPETYVDRSFPEGRVTLDDLAPSVRDAAAAICRRAGVTDPDLVESCTLDVALTGQADFATASAASQSYIDGDIEESEPTRTTIETGQVVELAVTRPGGSVVATFTADAGDQAVVETSESTLPDSCDVLRVIGPDGARVSTGCIRGGSGRMETGPLAASGTHQLLFDPGGRDTGTVEVSLDFVGDQDGTITPNGPTTSATIAEPGAAARFRFEAPAGQRVFVEVPSTTVPDGCNVLRVIAPDGGMTATGCITRGTGQIDTVTLAAAGAYEVVVDPAGDGTGTAEVRLVFVTDQDEAITADGSPRLARIDRSGKRARFRFEATAGQRISVEATSSTLPDACDLLRLVGPDGGTKRVGCVLRGAGGIDPVVLDAGGRYELVVDPGGPATGSVEVRLRD